MWRKRKLSLKQRSLPHFQLGESGEDQALEFLKKLGWKILATNIKFSYYELDIVAVDNDNQDLVFVEVKTRASNQYGDPSLAVSPKKVRSLQRFSREYLRKTKWQGSYRFDTISVVAGTIQHYRNITWLMKR